ncbi:hypothetical protein CHELA1G11_20142 [Hyphomicrobiales bacterium]|nr:hypothetical protein CHELA1G11_20142 [Hyphomicrobiales bacterium]CAH1688848.1 hypothetical protein CHELA1G2_20458 [Hyphomicrobiales bacterium]
MSCSTIPAPFLARRNGQRRIRGVNQPDSQQINKPLHTPREHVISPGACIGGAFDEGIGTSQLQLGCSRSQQLLDDQAVDTSYDRRHIALTNNVHIDPRSRPAAHARKASPCALTFRQVHIPDKLHWRETWATHLFLNIPDRLILNFKNF